MRALVLLGLLVVSIAVLAPAEATQASDALIALNAQRAASGIPGDVVENHEWSAHCSRHIDYMRQSGDFGHDEDPSSPHYSDEGAWAGGSAVLASGGGWYAGGRNPFEWAPIHLSQMLAPALAETGIAVDGYVCMTTWPGYSRTVPEKASVIAYPGEGVEIYAEESSNEQPFTPAQKLGLSNPTGPHIYVYSWGMDPNYTGDSTISSAVLVGPSGPVEVRWVDSATAEVGSSAARIGDSDPREAVGNGRNLYGVGQLRQRTQSQLELSNSN